MRFPFPRLTHLFIALGLAGAVAACKQGIGDRCQLDSDCSGGSDTPQTVRCVVPAAQRNIGGTCQSIGGTTTSDMALPADLSLLSQPDSSVVDMTAPPDLTMPPDLTLPPDLTMPPDLTLIDM